MVEMEGGSRLYPRISGTGRYDTPEEFLVFLLDQNEVCFVDTGDDNDGTYFRIYSPAAWVKIRRQSRPLT